jgi:type I restriction enzyme S subunit
MSEWKEYNLGDSPLEIIDGDRGKNYPSQDDFYKNGYCLFLSTRNVRIEGFDFSECAFISKEKDNLLRKGKLQRFDCVLTTRGTIGNLAFYSKNVIYNNVRINSGMVILRPNIEYINPIFNYYVLKNLQSEFFKYTSGSAQPQLPIRDLSKIKILLPDLPTQTAIAEILSSLDDKIELNNIINQKLETLAQTLFKQWFIDFEFPNENGELYKSSGGEMVDSELGEIPVGWSVYSMDELLETVSITYPLKKVNEVVFLNTGDIQDGKFLHKNFSNPENLPGQAKKSISQNDILYSEIRPANKRFAYVYFDSSQYVVSTKLMVLRSKVKINSLFQYFYLTQQESINYLQQLAESRSGTFPQITFSEVSTLKLALPNFNIVNTFVEIALKPYYDNQFKIKEENELLAELRDTLLPKLISGDLEINEISN